MEQVPRSPYEKVGGMVYFGRMVDKIRLFDAGTLRSDLHANLGKGFDAACCEFLRVSYEDVRRKVKEGLSDEEILSWCFATGGPRGAFEIQLWNWALSRRGWRDDLSPRLRQRLEEGGWGHRTDILTFFDYIDLDEGRPPRQHPAV